MECYFLFGASTIPNQYGMMTLDEKRRALVTKVAELKARGDGSYEKLAHSMQRILELARTNDWPTKITFARPSQTLEDRLRSPATITDDEWASIDVRVHNIPNYGDGTGLFTSAFKEWAGSTMDCDTLLSPLKAVTWRRIYDKLALGEAAVRPIVTEQTDQNKF